MRTQEGVLSSKMEGTQATLGEVLSLRLIRNLKMTTNGLTYKRYSITVRRSFMQERSCKQGRLI